MKSWFEINGELLAKNTTKKDANFALTAMLNGKRVIVSLHKTENYGTVSNSSLTDLQIAKRI
jgi:hypothetical protein